MTSLKDDQVDRRKVEAWQHVELKRTNRGIAFLWIMRQTYGVTRGLALDFHHRVD